MKRSAYSYVGRHYSREPRAALSGNYYGTGLRGAEGNRVRQPADARLKHRIYFYIDTAEAGIVPEAGVGTLAHEVQLDNLYDPTTQLIEYPGDANAFESAVLDAGNSGRRLVLEFLSVIGIPISQS
jgi:hypothetical protein